VLLFLYTVTTYSTILALNEQNAPIFTSNSTVFVSGGAKTLFAPSTESTLATLLVDILVGIYWCIWCIGTLRHSRWV